MLTGALVNSGNNNSFLHSQMTSIMLTAVLEVVGLFRKKYQLNPFLLMTIWKADINIIIEVWGVLQRKHSIRLGPKT